MEACLKISSVCPVPWILLSAAVDYKTYLRQVAIACQAGASGIAVGRAVWQESVELKGPQRSSFLQTTGRERLQHLAAICEEAAKPISDFYQTVVPFDWYSTYPE
jgi:tagatose-1,6-bisphosphate aldolase